MRNMLKSERPLVHGARTGSVRRLAAQLRRFVLDRAVVKAVQSIERNPPPDASVLRDMGLGPSEAERLASELQVLTADPYSIGLKPNASSIKPKPRSR
jgi:hypothetical protein